MSRVRLSAASRQSLENALFRHDFVNLARFQSFNTLKPVQQQELFERLFRHTHAVRHGFGRVGATGCYQLYVQWPR